MVLGAWFFGGLGFRVSRVSGVKGDRNLGFCG